MAKYMDKKDVKPDRMYDIDYKWGNDWCKGWGRLNTKEAGDHVNIITRASGGVSNVQNDEDVQFIKLANIR